MVHIPGIPWICDIISKAVVHVYGKENSFEVRVMLDILNLLAVTLINENLMSIVVLSGCPIIPVLGVQEDSVDQFKNPVVGTRKIQPWD